MKLPFQKTAVESSRLRHPAPSPPPQLPSSDLAALYRAARVGGDFFEFIKVGNDRLVLVLLDIAGKRDQALDVAAAVQVSLRDLAPKLFGHSDLNEADAVTDLVLHLNQAILTAANGVRCAPGFVGCYNEKLGIVTYINAGSVPALVRDKGSISVLEASGLPLGLFSHATHDAQICVLPQGAALLLASRGLVEVRAGTEEYGIERLKSGLQAAELSSANEMCASVLRHVSEFAQKKQRRFFRFGAHQALENALRANDITAVGLLRSAARSRAATAR